MLGHREEYEFQFETGLKLPWIPEHSVNNKLKRREGSGSRQGSLLKRANHKTELMVLAQNLY
jgi:hypothetical protein